MYNKLMGGLRMYNKNGHQRRQRRLYAVVECLKEGKNTKQIAEELGVQIRTIQRDIKYIRENQNQ